MAQSRCRPGEADVPGRHIDCGVLRLVAQNAVRIAVMAYEREERMGHRRERGAGIIEMEDSGHGLIVAEGWNRLAIPSHTHVARGIAGNVRSTHTVRGIKVVGVLLLGEEGPIRAVPQRQAGDRSEQIPQPGSSQTDMADQIGHAHRLAHVLLQIFLAGIYQHIGSSVLACDLPAAGLRIQAA